MSEFTDLSADLLDLAGTSVTWTPDGGEAASVDAVVTDHGFLTRPPNEFPAELFDGQGFYAVFRTAWTDAVAIDDVITWDGRDYDIRHTHPEPKTGADKVFQVAYGVAEQRGRFSR